MASDCIIQFFLNSFFLFIQPVKHPKSYVQKLASYHIPESDQG
jgi:hypothetical protein